MSWWKTAETPSPVPPSPGGGGGGSDDPDSAVKRISLEAASREELAAFVKQQGALFSSFLSTLFLDALTGRGQRLISRPWSKNA